MIQVGESSLTSRRGGEGGEGRRREGRGEKKFMVALPHFY